MSAEVKGQLQVLILSAAVILASIYVFQPQWLLHRKWFDFRVDEYRLRAWNAPEGSVMVVGDSISYFTNYSTLCGRPVFNASVGGSKTTDWLPHVKPLIAEVKPKALIVELGTNDQSLAWRKAYREYAKIATVMVAPADPNKEAFLRSLDVEVVSMPRQTTDGIHLTRAATFELVRRIEVALCPLIGAS